MVIQTGVLGYNQQLPIPTGFKEEECIWIVSAKTLHESWAGESIDFLRCSYCLLDSNRVNKSWTDGDIGGRRGIPIYYMIIAAHGSKLQGISPRILKL